MYKEINYTFRTNKMKNKIKKLETLKFNHQLQIDLGNITRAELLKSAINKLTLKLEQDERNN